MLLLFIWLFVAVSLIVLGIFLGNLYISRKKLKNLALATFCDDYIKLIVVDDLGEVNFSHIVTIALTWPFSVPVVALFKFIKFVCGKVYEVIAEQLDKLVEK